MRVLFIGNSYIYFNNLPALLSRLAEVDRSGPAIETKQAALSEAYRTIAQELRAAVAPVGAAWQAARGQDPNLKLYQEDHSHPSASGTYLAALVFLAVLRGDLPQDLPATVSGLPDPMAPGTIDLTVSAAQIPGMRRAALRAAGSQQSIEEISGG